MIDHCLGRVHVAAALRAAGQQIELLTDHFPEDTPDQDWLTVAGERRWVVLTKDRYFSKRPLELAAVIRSKARAFVLSAGNLRGAEQASAFAVALPKMLRVCHQRGPIIANVTAGGAVKVHDSRELKKWLR